MRLDLWIILIEFFMIIVTRFAYRLLNPQWTNTDAFAHFNIIREIRLNGHRIPEDHSRTFHPGEFTYPALIHILLSILPEDYLELTDRIFSVMIDLLIAVLLFALVPMGLLNISQITILLALFVATPQFVRPDHPHGVGLSARKPGVLLSSAGIVTFLAWFSGGTIGFLIIAMATGALLPLTSRFSTQAFAFTTLALGIFVTPTAILYLIGSLLLAFVISGGYYWKILVAHFWFSIDFAKVKQYKFLYDGLKSINTFKRIITGVKRRSVRDILEALFDSILLRSLFDNPFVIAASVAIFFGPPIALPQSYLIWIYAGFAVYVLTSFYHLRFLGHAGRYLEHIFVPCAVVIASMFGEYSTIFDWVVYLTVFIGLITIGIYIMIQQRWTDISERESLSLLVKQLKKLPTGRVLVQPRYGGSEIAWKTGHSVNDFLGTGFESPEVIAKRNRLYPEKEGWVTDETSWLASEFDPDWMVFDRTVSENSPQNALSEPDREPVWESDSLALYKFDR